MLIYCKVKRTEKVNFLAFPGGTLENHGKDEASALVYAWNSYTDKLCYHLSFPAEFLLFMDSNKTGGGFQFCGTKYSHRARFKPISMSSALIVKFPLSFSQLK
jgi:hypothetical protein